MAESVSKRIAKGSRSPAVTFAIAWAGGLSIRVDIPPKEVKAVVAMAASKARAKARASKLVLAAVRGLKRGGTRDRSGFVQADIPTQLKVELASISEAKQTTVTSLIFDKLARWIDPESGKRRVKKAKDGTTSLVGPKNFRGYALATNLLYAQALKDGSMARL